MKRDPFYQLIIDRLNAPLDAEVFERCAADILRHDFATLVPIRGGNDNGMDGAIADGEGEPFPLVSTTSEDVSGNLGRNLTTYVTEGGTRRKAILATSQELTDRRRFNLKKKALELGFVLISIYTQSAMADRLYRNSHWCHELLGLTGAPPALSIVPMTVRPLMSSALIGRDDDIKWLHVTDGDRLIMGQPGCGKTCILRTFAEQNTGLFAVSEDRGEIAAAFRDQQPTAIIVDDAHLKLGLLASLRQMRTELGASFDIVASCWPGQNDKANVMQALAITEHKVREIELLSRDDIVAVIASAGITGSIELVRELVDQAEGKPGLAVTLAHLCLQGGVREVIVGDALSRYVNPSLGLISR